MTANILHSTLQKTQIGKTAFDDGRSADAVRDAFGEVLRQACELAGGADCSPVVLTHAAFASATGRLSDPAPGVSAQRAIRRMFVKSFVQYRLDAEHATAPDDQPEAVQGVLLARKLAGGAQRPGNLPPHVPQLPS
jgi:hypothetical protein